ncbi:MAG: transglutaminase domain-containing protein, partial [Eubacterium sp.]|nr:transglutaminase domain-containing protein [Eubacterium sp.]
MNEKKMTGFFVFISVVLCLSVALSGFSLYSQKKTETAINQLQGEAEDVDREDDVTIAGTYTIKSTTQISDAYISGDSSKLDDSDKETLDMASAVIDEVIKPSMNDFEKEKAIYDWLTAKLTSNTGILTVVPTRNGDNDNPHDVLKYRSAVCVGYATTFRLFMQMLKIECKVIHSSDLTHSWDLVKLDDGWYHTDCYMDNETNNYQNF